MFKRFFVSRLFFVVAIILLGLITTGYMRAYYQDYRIKQEIIQLENEVRALESKKIESMELLDYVMSQAYVEEKARVELNMKKKGEKVVIIKSDQNANDIEQTNSDGTRSDISNPVKWFYFFLHKQI